MTTAGGLKSGDTGSIFRVSQQIHEGRTVRCTFGVKLSKARLENVDNVKLFCRYLVVRSVLPLVGGGRRQAMKNESDDAKREVILLVDDEADHLTITSRFLESVGYVCICAERGWDALRLLSEQRVDLILLDLHMPGMDGYCLAENILAHERYRSIPIVAFSCYDLTKFKQRAMRIGMADFVPKPVDRKRLLATVRDQLRLRKRLSALNAVEGDLGVEDPAKGLLSALP